MRFNKILAKRILAAALALALGVTSVTTVPTSAEAAAGDETILLSKEYNGESSVNLNCTIEDDSYVYIDIHVENVAEVYINVDSDSGDTDGEVNLDDNACRLRSTYGGYSVISYLGLDATPDWEESTIYSGWYMMRLPLVVKAEDSIILEGYTTSSSTLIQISYMSDEEAIKIGEYSYDSSSSSSGSASTILTEAENNLTIVRSPYVTIGFTQTLAMKGYDNTEVTWSSSDTSIATINKKGVVTGVALGKVTITASIETTAGMASSTYNITVRKNEYTEKKMTLKDCVKGSSTVNVYKIKYDSDGNLIVKVRFLNRTKKMVKFEPDVFRGAPKGILIRDASAGMFASCCNKAIKVKAKSYKTATYTIKKSKLLTKSTCNLAAATIFLNF